MIDKRQKIITAAKDVFRTKGLEKAKVADITKAAGIAQGTFYLYFPSKLSVMPDIAMQVVQRMIDDVQKNFDAEATLSDKLQHVVDSMFRCLEEDRDVYALLLAGLIPAGYSKQWDHIYDPFYQWVGGFLQEYQDKGQIRPDCDAQRTAKLFLGIVENTAERLFLFDEPTEDEVRMEKVELMRFIRNATLA